VRHGDGWYGHDLSVSEATAVLRRIEEERERADRKDHPFEVTTRAMYDVSLAEIQAFASIGVDRLILDVGSAAINGLSTVVSRIERIGREVVDLQ
jgi:hypothetical protein